MERLPRKPDLDNVISWNNLILDYDNIILQEEHTISFNLGIQVVGEIRFE